MIKCFERELDRTRSHTYLAAGLRVIRVSQITGTVNKCDELDWKFRNVRRNDRNERSRRQHLMRAMHRHSVLAPIDVYQYRREFYVVDGNRRVAAAIENKIEFIDAAVTEVLVRDEPMEMRGALSRRSFETRTGLSNIELSHPGGYSTLLRKVEKYGKNGGSEFRDRARRWYTVDFLPACRKIKDSKLTRVYEEFHEGDVYVLVVDFYFHFMGGRPDHADFDLLISGFLFAHHIREGASFSSLFRRMLGLSIGESIMGHGKRKMQRLKDEHS
jgi:hypothetical protein